MDAVMCSFHCQPYYLILMCSCFTQPPATAIPSAPWSLVLILVDLSYLLNPLGSVYVPMLMECSRCYWHDVVPECLELEA